MKRMIRFRFSVLYAPVLTILLLLASGLATPALASDTTILDCDNDDALSNALVGVSSVTFSCGNAHLAATIDLDSTKPITANTTIDGGGKVTLSGGFGNRLFVVNNSVTLTLRNITLINGYNSSAAGGGAVSNNGHLILEHVTIHTMPDSAFNGGAIATYGTADITDSEIYDTKATNGGAIFASGPGATVNLTDSKVHDNGATGTSSNGLGGAIYLYNGAHANLTNSQVYANKARQGAGIYIAANSVASLTASLIDDNHAYANNSNGNDGGGIYNKGITTLSSSTISRNEGYTYAGGIDNDHGTLTVTDSIISGNYTSVAGGGGIANDGGTITLTDTTVSGNFAGGDAGGVENGNGTATLTNVTISGNNAYSGGGMWNLPGGTATLTNVTFYGNRVLTLASGIGNSNGVNTHLYLKNVIVTKSKGGDNCVFQKAPDTSDHNLSSDATCNFAPGGGGDSVKIKLGPLETNGGQTPTHRLLPGSAAIDNGVYVGTNLADQRGITRWQGASFDVGAVEFVPCPGAPTKSILLSPVANAKVTGQTPLLDWAGPDCVKTFSVVVRNGSKTGAIVFTKSSIKPSQVKTTTLAKNQKYFWQVTACNGAGCASSSWDKFTVK